MTEDSSRQGVEPKPGGHTALWLIVGPAAIVAALVFNLFRLAGDGSNVLPEAVIGAAVGAVLIAFLYGNDRPDPRALAKGRWSWGLAAILVAVVVFGGATGEAVLFGFLAGFLTLFVTIVGINMFRDRQSAQTRSPDA